MDVKQRCWMLPAGSLRVTLWGRNESSCYANPHRVWRGTKSLSRGFGGEESFCNVCLLE